MTEDLGLETFRFFERYQRWAMERVLAVARSAEETALETAILGSNGGGTLTGLLGHIVDADILWLSRWQGDSNARMQMPGAWATIAEIEAAWRADLPRRDTFFESLTVESLAGRFGPPDDSMILWQAMLHVQNHATHHRAEVCALLTMLGTVPESIDMLDFIDGR